MSNVVTKDQYDIMDRALSLIDSLDSPKAKMIAKARIEKKIKQDLAGEYTEREQHLTYVIARDAYKYVLEDSLSAKDALIESARLHEADIQAVLAEKSKNSGKLSGELVKQHDKHEVQKQLVKLRIFDRQSMKNSRNVWQLLKLLAGFKFLYDEIKRLRAEVDQVKHDQRLTNMALVDAKADIERLKEHTNMPPTTDKERVRILKDLGYSQKSVAEVTGKSLRTIKRWWNLEIGKE